MIDFVERPAAQRVWLPLAFAVSIGVSACGGDNSPPLADSVFVNGKVLTVDANSTVAQAFAVRDGKFVAVGSSADMLTLVSATTKVVDLGGRTVVPALSDAHMHNEGGGPGIDLSLTRTIAQLLAKVSAAAATAKAGDILVSNNDWHEAQLAEQRLPLAAELESAAPGIPVVLVRGGHDYILNTTALNKWNITKTTPVPPGGAITKDASGELTGELVDAAKALVTLPPAPPVTADDFVRTQQKLNSFGIVNVRVPGSYRGNAFSDYKILKQMRDGKQLTLRYSFMLPAFGTFDAFKAAIDADNIKPGEGDAFLRLWGIKTGVDGGFEGGHMSAAYQEPFGKGGTFFGLTTDPPANYNAKISAIHKLGFRVSTHAVGDAAVDQVLAAYEQAHAEKDLSGEGWAIEHAFITRPEQYPRMKAMKLNLSVQDHLYLAAPTLKNYWGLDRASRVTALKTFADQGFLLAGGTDTPVIPFNPFWVMYHFLSRDTISAGVYGAAEAVPDRWFVLRMMTINFAKLTGDDSFKGSIESGKVADFAVLSEDYLTIPVKQVESLKALATYLEGKSVYQDPSVSF